MPTYKVTDPQSGRTLKLTGDSPPTEQELEQIFASVNKPKSTLDKVGDVVAPTLSSLAKGSGTFLGTFSPDYKASQEAQQRAEQMTQRVAEKARQETNPETKSLLVKSALSGRENLVNIATQEAKDYQTNAGITDEQMKMSPLEYGARKGVGSALEVGSMVLPFTKAGMAAQATRGGRVLQATKLGAGMGALASGGESIGTTDKGVVDTAKNIVKGGLAGGVTGGVTQGLIETPGLIKDFVGKKGINVEKKLYDLYKSTLKRNIKDQNFYKQYGGEDKVIKDALEFNLASTKNGIERQLSNYQSEYKKIIEKEAELARKNGKYINVSKAFKNARDKVIEETNYDKTLQKSALKWFDDNSQYLRMTRFTPEKSNTLRKSFDKKVGDLIAGDISAMSDLARKRFATELRNEFKAVISDEGKKAIRKYQLLSGLSEAMKIEPMPGLVETTYGAIGALASPLKIPGMIAGLIGGTALRSPGLKRKIAKEVIGSGITKTKPAIQKAVKPVGQLLSPFVSRATTK